MNVWQLLEYYYGLSRKWFNLNWEDGYTLEELKEQYRKLAKKYHNDINPNAINEMQEIIEAYSYLKCHINKNEDIIYNKQLKELKHNFQCLLHIIEEDQKENFIVGQTGQRLSNNANVIREQINKISFILNKSFKALDLHIQQYPDSTITRFLIEDFQRKLDKETFYCGNKKTHCEMFAASLEYEYCEAFYQKAAKINFSTLGDGRKNLRKARNKVCRSILTFAKVMSGYLRIINNGIIEEVSPQKEEQAIMNTIYMCELDNFDKWFNQIRNSSNYYCFISAEEKENHKKLKCERKLNNNK